VSNNKKSPLKERPLHVAGQSLDEKINDYISYNASNYYTVIGITVSVTAALWIYYFFPKILIPMFLTIVTVVTVIICSCKLATLKRKVKDAALGRNGERIVAEILDDLRSGGCVVFHDIVDKNNSFNIDHVVLSPNGIFTVETKTYSKPPKGEISFKADNIIVGGFNKGDKIIKQAESQAKWLKSMLRESTGKNYNVMPVIVFPGWFVQPMPDSLKKRIWVLNPEVLQSFIKNESETIEENDMRLAVFHISRYIRMYN